MHWPSEGEPPHRQGPMSVHVLERRSPRLIDGQHAKGCREGARHRRSRLLWPMPVCSSLRLQPSLHPTKDAQHPAANSEMCDLYDDLHLVAVEGLSGLEQACSGYYELQVWRSSNLPHAASRELVFPGAGLKSYLACLSCSRSKDRCKRRRRRYGVYPGILVSSTQLICAGSRNCSAYLR